MPPIKRTQKPAASPGRRRLAGHVDTAKPQSAAPYPATPRTEVGSAGTRTTPGPKPPRGTSDETVTNAGEFVEKRRERAGSRSLGRPLAYAALAVGVVAGALGVFLATEPGVNIQNRAFVDSTETDEVLSAATTNVQRLVAIDHETLDDYHDSLGEFLTQNLVTELDENWPTLKDSYEQTATAVDADVREAGLAYLEGDRAEVLLVQDVSMTRDGNVAGSTSGTYLVGLERVDGVWKLSRIPDLPS